jgi:hypothetical protein
VTVMGALPGRRMDMTFKQLYAWYISSETWRALRERCLKRDKRTCQCCGATEDLHVHHLTYERFTHEILSDLITVCETCHDYIHRQARENPRLTLEEATRRAIRERRKRRAMRQQRRKGKVTVQLDKDEKCRCGQLVRIRHRHDKGLDQPGTEIKPKVKIKSGKPTGRIKSGLPKVPGLPELKPGHIWVCTKGKGWHQEPRE